MELKSYLKIIGRRWYVFVIALAASLALHAYYVDTRPRTFEATSRLLINDESYSHGRLDRTPYPFGRKNLLGFFHRYISVKQDEILGNAALALWSYPGFENTSLAAAARTHEDPRNTERLAKLLMRAVTEKKTPLGPGEPASVFSVSCTLDDPRLAVLIANVVAGEAVKHYEVKTKSIVEETMKTVSAKLKEARTEFIEINRRKERLADRERGLLRSGKIGAPMIPAASYEKSETELATLIINLRKRIDNIKFELKNARWKYERRLKIKDEVEKEAQNASEVADNPLVKALENKVAEIQDKMKSLRENPPYRTAGHPTMDVYRAVLAGTRVDLDRAREKAVESYLHKWNNDADELNDRIGLLETTLLELEPELKRRDAQMKRLRSLKLELKKISHAVEQRNAKIMRLEELEEQLEVRFHLITSPLSPFQPAVRAELLTPAGGEISDWLLVAVLALAAASFIVFAIEYFDRRITTTVDVRKYMNVPVLSTIPVIREHNKLLSRAGIGSPMAEHFYTAATTVGSIMRRRGAKSLLLTSNLPREGKTTLAINLAIASARKGARVILCDTDFRKPGIHNLLRLPDSEGLSDILDSRYITNHLLDNFLHEHPDLTPDLGRFLLEPGVRNLRILTAGQMRASGQNLLDSSEMHLFIKAATDEADLVIFDTPPVSVVGDAMTIAPLVDVTLLVTSSGVLNARQAGWLKHMLVTGGANLLGMLLNRAPVKQGGEYYVYSQHHVHKDVREA